MYGLNSLCFAFHLANKGLCLTMHLQRCGVQILIFLFDGDDDDDDGTSGGGNSTCYVTGTCHFAQKVGTHNSVNFVGF